MKDFDIFKATPFITGVMIFSGALKYIFYYQLFNVEIIHFITIPEILKLFVHDLFYYILTAIFFFYVTSSYLQKAGIKPVSIMKPYKRPLPKWYIIALDVVILVIIIHTMYKLLWKFNNSGAGVYAWLFLFLLIWMNRRLTLDELYKEHLPDITPKKKFYINFIIIIFLSLNAYSLMSAYATYWRYTHYRETRLRTIVLESGKTIPAFSNEYYIGATDNFLFTFDEKSMQTKEIKMNDVKSMTFQRSSIADTWIDFFW